MNKSNLKKYSIIILIIIVVLAVFLSIKPKESVAPVEISNNITSQSNETEGIFNLCYYKSKKTDRGFYDSAWLKLNISGDKINGDFYNLPAEKDSQVGKFNGTVSKVDPKISRRVADVSWNSLTEGINETKQIKIEFGEGSAVVLINEFNSKIEIPEIDCDYLDEKLFVEKYIKDNINTLAINKPVLGGTWYVTSVVINESTSHQPVSKSGKIFYEDGHVTAEATFIYTYEKNPQNVNIHEFKIVI